MSWWVYILRCGDGTLYTGTAADVERRLAAHRRGRGAKYTRGRGPLAVVYREACPDRGAALRREAAIKKYRRAEKEALITDYAERRSRMKKAAFIGTGNMGPRQQCHSGIQTKRSYRTLGRYSSGHCSRHWL